MYGCTSSSWPLHSACLSQTLSSMGKGGVTAVSLLNRREPCGTAFFKALGAMVDKGVDVNFKVRLRKDR